MPITVPGLSKLKADGHRITMVTAYDAPSARFADESQIEVILVGDSLGMVVQGAANTLAVTLEESLYHTRLVSGACTNALVVGDMPFGTYHESRAVAIRNASRYLKEAGAQAVKLEGGAVVQEQIEALVAAQIPVMAHIGLTPQSVHAMGGFKIQRQAERLLADARLVQEAGAFSVVLEGIPGPIAQEITASLSIPTIGIGAGIHCDGQVLVWHDLLGLNDAFVPKFAKQYAALADTVRAALTAFRDEVRAGDFPTDAHTYS